MQMRSICQRLFFMSLLYSLMCNLTGCVTASLSGALAEGDEQTRRDFYSKPILSDLIVAIGRPNAELAKQLGDEHVIAFLGRKNTYLLSRGGEELEHISKLNLDTQKLTINAVGDSRLYLKDKQIWGQVILSYGDANAIQESERTELERAGFGQEKYQDAMVYQKSVDIEGTIYPAIKFSDAELAHLTVPRAISFFNPVDSRPSPNSGRALLGI